VDELTTLAIGRGRLGGFNRSDGKDRRLSPKHGDLQTGGGSLNLGGGRLNLGGGRLNSRGGDLSLDCSAAICIAAITAAVVCQESTRREPSISDLIQPIPLFQGSLASVNNDEEFVFVLT